MIWKAFQSKAEWRFPFWNIFFGFRDIHVLYYANEENDDVIGGSSETAKFKAVFFKLGCFRGTTYDVITFLICIKQKREYL